jgi:GT2 family glycosyltransferase
MKILIAVLTCSRYLDRRNAVRDSWMSWVRKLNDNLDVKFFSGTDPCPADDMIGDIVHLSCPDDYEHLPYKTFELCKYALANRYDNLIKVDDDTFLMPMPDYLAELTSVPCMASMRIDPPHNDRIKYPQGGCYSLDKRAMLAVVKQPLLFRQTGLEDALVGKALFSMGVPQIHSERIKTDHRLGFPSLDNDIISTHACSPDALREIRGANLVRLLATFSQKQPSPAPVLKEPTERTLADFSMEKSEPNSRDIVQSLWIGERLTAMEQTCIKSYLHHGHPFHLYTYGPVADVPKGCVIKDANEIVLKERVFVYEGGGFGTNSYAGFADLFRYSLLYKKGNWWVDTDSICIAPLVFDVPYVFSSERSAGMAYTNCGNLKAPAGSDIYKWLVDQCKDIDKNMQWGAIGPKLMHQAVERFKLQRYVQRPEVFCPIPFSLRLERNTMIDPTVPAVLYPDSRAVHLWNEAWRNMKQDKDAKYATGCLYEQLKRRYSPPKTALVLIATGEPYWQYIEQNLEGAAKNFPQADVLLFTDSPTRYKVAKQVKIPHAGWPDVTLLRHKTILSQSKWLAKYEYVYHTDIDMKIIRPLPPDIYADGLVVTIHPNFIGKPGTPETNPRSTAYLPLCEVKQYVCGGFQGGTVPAYLAMAETVVKNVETDKANGFTAVWHDESHLNRYVHDHMPAKILPKPYCTRHWEENLLPYAFVVTVDKKTPDRPAVNGVQPPDPLLTDMSDVTALLKTFMREESLYHCVKTLKENYPSIHVIVADDGPTNKAKQAKLKTLGVERYISLPADSGLSKGRNVLIDACTTPYCLIADDDFGFKDSHLEYLRGLMDVADIAAGRVLQVGTQGFVQSGNYLDFGGNFVKVDGKLFFTPAKPEWYKQHTTNAGIQSLTIQYTKADLVLNFFIAKTAVIKRLRWDEEIKVGYEHEDFFIRARGAFLDVVLCPDAVAQHQEMDDARNPAYLQHRNDYRPYEAVFLSKWGFEPSKPLVTP